MIIYSAASSALEGVQNLPLSLAFTLSENTHTRLHYRELAQTVKKNTPKHTLPNHISSILFPNPSLLVYLQRAKNKNSLSRLLLACQSKAE